jgi:predicted transposase YbfD/YdcC
MPITTAPTNNEPEITIGTEEKKFIDALKNLADPRDPRGKRHSLEFLITAFIFATLVGRSTVSGIHRYITNKIDWLREVTGIEDATPISRAHLPRMLAGIDWLALNCVISDCFGERIVQLIENEWIAADGKVLRGTLKSGEKQAVIHAVSHDSRIDVAQARQVGDKTSEITVMRDFLKETGLGKHNISLDAHHCNPETMADIEKTGGKYLIQLKENQPKLLEQCRILSGQKPLADTIAYDSGHGYVTTRQAQLFNLQTLDMDERWLDSGLRSLVVVERETYCVARNKTTHETAYYLSNLMASHELRTVEILAAAIRGHWGVESNNWQLDVTLNEDHVKTIDGNQAQIMAKLRCFAMNLLRWSKKGTQNFQATIDKFTDCPETLLSTLRQVNFL